MDDLHRYVFPRREDISYERFDAVRALLPAGMGVCGQYGDIFTMTWEMMGFENFSMAVFEEPGLVEELNNRVGAIVIRCSNGWPHIRRWTSSGTATTLRTPPD